MTMALLPPKLVFSGVNMVLEVRNVSAFALHLSVESCKMALKIKRQFVSVGFITNWNFEMLAAVQFVSKFE